MNEQARAAEQIRRTISARAGVIAGLLMPALLWLGAAAPGSAQGALANERTEGETALERETARGQTLYRLHCASCHGKKGLGDGPVAEALVTKPGDLTRLASRAGGKFLEDEVRSSIDGRTELRAHGTSEMPVWGLSFAERGRDTPQETEVEAEIRALVRYLRTIQEP